MRIVSSQSIYASTLLIVIFVVETRQYVTLATAQGKLFDLGENLVDQIKNHPDKSWLIKFYAPWCHHCRQLETTYINVAEKIYHGHDRLIVGRVDCTKHSKICGHFDVKSYPTISYIGRGQRFVYKGDRTVKGILDFVRRLEGPDIRHVRDCRELNDLREMNQLIVVSTHKDNTSVSFDTFKSLAAELKASHWFHQIDEDCKGSFEPNQIYILKQHLDRPIEFQPPTDDQKGLRQSLLDWLGKNSLPVYGQIGSSNFDRYKALGKPVVIAALEQYNPTRQIMPQSLGLRKSMEQVAKTWTKTDDTFSFAWSTDTSFLSYIRLGDVSLPNLIIVNLDLSHYLHITVPTPQGELDDGTGLPRRLGEEALISTIRDAQQGKLTYEGGDSYPRTIYRFFYSKINDYVSIWRQNPILLTLLIGMPGVILAFAIYATCSSEGPYDPNEEILDSDSGDEAPYEEQEVPFKSERQAEKQRLLTTKHDKQD